MEGLELRLRLAWWAWLLLGAAAGVLGVGAWMEWETRRKPTRLW